MRNLYQRLINYSVEQRIKRYEQGGKKYNKDKIVKEMEATNPIALFLLFQGLIWVIVNNLKLGIYEFLFPYMRLVFIILIVIISSETISFPTFLEFSVTRSKS